MSRGVVVIAPGLINTPMAVQIEANLALQSQEPRYEAPLRAFTARMRRAAAEGVPLDRVITAILHALASRRPPARREIHNSVWRDVVLLRMLPRPVRDRLLARALALR